MLRPFFPELVMSTDLLSFEHPSVLLFSLYQQRVRIPIGTNCALIIVNLFVYCYDMDFMSNIHNPNVLTS